MHLYRNGIIEIVDALLLSHMLPNTNQRFIPAVEFERYAIIGTARGLRLLRRIGASGPVAIAITLTSVKNMILGINDWRFYTEQSPVLNEHLFLPEAIVNELEVPFLPVIKPIIDLVWNACGVGQSIHFDAAGNWTQAER